jgi:hypothetical protein
MIAMWVEDAGARHVVAEAMIAAFNNVTLQLPPRQRNEAMSAAIGEGNSPAVLSAEHDDWLVEDNARCKFATDLTGPSGGVPGISYEGHGVRSCRLVWRVRLFHATT